MEVSDDKSFNGKVTQGTMKYVGQLPIRMEDREKIGVIAGKAIYGESLGRSQRKKIMVPIAFDGFECNVAVTVDAYFVGDHCHSKSCTDSKMELMDKVTELEDQLAQEKAMTADYKVENGTFIALIENYKAKLEESKRRLTELDYQVEYCFLRRETDKLRVRMDSVEDQLAQEKAMTADLDVLLQEKIALIENYKAKLEESNMQLEESHEMLNCLRKKSIEQQVIINDILDVTKGHG